MHNLIALERAFELANSGSCESVADIKKALKTEGYSDQQITGRFCFVRGFQTLAAFEVISRINSGIAFYRLRR